MSAEDEFPDVDVDEATLEVMRSNHREIRRLAAELGAGGPETLAVELVNISKRQEGLLSEVPGLEDHARQAREVREQIAAYYEIDGPQGEPL